MKILAGITTQKSFSQNYRRAALLFFSIFTFLSGYTQVFSGKVIDAITKKPVPFTNISFGDGKTGTISDLNGEFKTSLNNMKNPIVFSCVGYKKKKTDIISLMEASVIELEPEIIRLGSIDVFPGENPALTIMRKAVANKDKHNPDLTTNYSCIIYHKLNFAYNIPDTLDVKNDPELKKLKEFSDLSNLLLIESVSEKKHLRPNKTNERLISGRVSGFKDPALSYLPAQLQPFTFYSKYISLLDMEYLNPVSDQGLRFYTFLLTDTLVTAQNDTVFYIKFIPKKGKNFNGLKGALHIYQPDWAIKTVSVESVSSDNSNILKIRQNYRLVNDSIWFPFQMESNLTIKNIKISKQKGVNIPVTASGKSYVTAINLDPKITARDFNNVTFKDDLSNKNNKDVSSFRYSPLTHKDSVTYFLIDSIGRAKHLDKLITFQKAAVVGNIPWGIIDLDYRKFFDYNGYEGFKLGIGLWTNKKLSEYFSFGGYYTYAFKIDKSNFGAGFNLTPWKDPDAKFSFYYKDDVFATGTFSFLDAYKIRSPESFQRFLFETMDNTKEYTIDAKFRFLKHFKTAFGFKHASITPQKEYRFSVAPDTVAPFSTNEFSVRLKWVNKETFSDTPFGRVSNNSVWPKVWLNFTYGTGEQTVDFTYQKYEAQIHQDIKLNPANTTTIRVKGGLISGDLPSTLLYSSFGSYKSFGLEIPYSMATMRLNEFAADRFAILNLKHQINMFQNKEIKFKPEVVLTTNIGFGEGPADVYSFNKGYYESGIFFNNLFRQLIARYGFAIHYRYGPYHLSKEINNWAFNIGIEFLL
jgi:hypothetical protein